MWLDLKYAILDYDVSGTIWISLVMIFFWSYGAFWNLTLKCQKQVQRVRGKHKPYVDAYSSK